MLYHFIKCCSVLRYIRDIHRKNENVIGRQFRIVSYSETIIVRILSTDLTKGGYRAINILIYKLRHNSLTLSSSTVFLAVNINFAPCFANNRAIYSPIPLDAPVIHTTFPLNLAAINKYSVIFIDNALHSQRLYTN